MTMDPDMPPQVKDEAERWFARLLAPDCGAGEREAFERWRRDNPAHERAYADTERLWRRLGEPAAAAHPRLRALAERALAGTAALPQQDEWQRTLASLPPRSRPRSSAVPRWRRWTPPAALAAAVALAAVFIAPHFLAGPAPPESVYATSDRLRQVELEDGSRLQLDVGTEVAVRYDREGRAVDLRHGRAVFEVAHDPRRPFTVDLGDSRITVLGTRFQAVREGIAVSVTLAEGSLRLNGESATHGRSEQLVPGEQIRYSLQAPADWQRRRVDAAVATAWTRGRLVFRATPLGEAVKDVNRYAARKLRLGDPDLAGLPVSGSFVAGDSATVAEAWQAVLPVRATLRDDVIVLERRTD